MEIIAKIAESIHARIEGHHQAGPKPVGHLLAIHPNLEGLLLKSSEVITVGITRKSALANISSKVGRVAQKDMDLPQDSIQAIFLGAFVVESFCMLGLVSVSLKKNSTDKFDTYHVLAGSNEGFSELLTLVDPTSTNFPSLTPYADWTCGKHENGAPFIKNGNKTLLATINATEHYYPLAAVNKLQQGGWKINLPVYEAFKHFFSLGGHPEIFPHNDEEKAPLTRSGLATEAEYIIKCANNIGDQTFYHQYNCDFRGRIYPLSAFLNEQSSDRSKGIMKFDKAEPLGPKGLYWLMFQAANVWGEDKLSLDGRVQFVEDSFEEWREWAIDPIANTGWMNADKPWSFLSAIIELYNVEMFAGEVEDYPCALPVFVDGSNNGVQHMTALTLDHKTAPLVNLVPQEEVGDVYMYMCDAVYAEIEKQYDPSLDEEFNAHFDEYKRLNAELYELKGDEFRAKLVELQGFREAKYAPNFFMSIKNPKTRRKIVKRPVMTLGYGGTMGGFSKMIAEDNSQTSNDFRQIQFVWASYFANLLFDLARGSRKYEARLKGLSQVLSLFEELAGDAVREGEKMSWNVPMTNFPVVQQYQRAKSKRLDVIFMGARLQFKISIYEDQRVNKLKQKTSAAPNIIHSFDAAHLTLTVVEMPFRLATIHDSFGCLPSNMEELFVGVRETFADFYHEDPMANLLGQLGALDKMPERGTLDLEDIIKSDFSFA